MVSVEQFATAIIMLVIEHYKYHTCTLHFNFENFMCALALVLKFGWLLLQSSYKYSHNAKVLELASKSPKVLHIRNYYN